MDEKLVAAQARAFSPNVDNRQTIAGIPVAEIRWLLDRQAIRDCLTRYLRGLDRHDALLMASAFWPDAQINYGSTFSGPRDEFIRWGNAWDAKRWLAHSHNLTNQTVEIDGDTAHVESYIVMLLRARDKSVTVAAGRYIDRFERRQSEWRIVVREYIVDVRANADGSSFDPATSCLPVCGKWDRGDLSYKRPLSRRPGSKTVETNVPPPS
jgi:hypothetical protein